MNLWQRLVGDLDAQRWANTQGAVSLHEWQRAMHDVGLQRLERHRRAKAAWRAAHPLRRHFRLLTPPGYR